MPETLKLLSRRDFVTTARDGDKFVARSVILQVRNRGDDARPRIGITATRKIGNAVTRNRAKRRLRAMAREVLGARAEAGHDYVLIARHNTPTRPWPAMIDEVDRLLDAHARQHRG